MPLVNKPTVAVWMVTYNHETYIAEAISSVMGQVTDFEVQLFIGEDCSTDGTRAICKTFADQYPDRITLLENSHNLGPRANAFQVYEACLASGAPYIALLEGDDYWTDPYKLQQQVGFLEANLDYGMCFTRFRTYDEDTGFFEDDRNTKFFQATNRWIDFDFDIFASGWHVGTQTLMYRACLFDPRLINIYQYFRDIHLFVELLVKQKGACLNMFSAIYRKHKGGTHSSMNKFEILRTATLTYEELYKKFKNLEYIKIKYNYFNNEYVGCLIQEKSFFKAFFMIAKYSLTVKDFQYLIRRLNNLVNTILEN